MFPSFFFFKISNWKVYGSISENPSQQLKASFTVHVYWLSTFWCLQIVNIFWSYSSPFSQIHFLPYPPYFVPLRKPINHHHHNNKNKKPMSPTSAPHLVLGVKASTRVWSTNQRPQPYSKLTPLLRIAINCQYPFAHGGLCVCFTSARWDLVRLVFTYVLGMPSHSLWVYTCDCLEVVRKLFLLQSSTASEAIFACPFYNDSCAL